MKKILLVLILTLLVSCKDWLVVKPFDTIEAYQNELSVNSVLNGLYVSLANNSLYAKELSCGAIEVLAQHYEVPSSITTSGSHEYYYLDSFNFEGNDQTKELLSRIFSTAYKTIAECNEFIDKVKKDSKSFSERKLNTYLGEAIAVRTLLHFDILRLFGPMGGELDRESIPYYDLSTSIPQPILTANEIVDLLIADIDKSIEYLKRDPVLEIGVTMPISEVRFFEDYRNMRMNYYAANVLKARMCLYKDTNESRELAYQICSSLIEGKDPQDPSISNNFKETFKFSINTLYYAFPSEIIFGIQNLRRENLNKSLFASELSAERILGGGERFIGYLYGLSGSTVIGGTDPIRSKMWRHSEEKSLYEFTRFTVAVTNPNLPYYNYFQSLIRLGEVYAIAAETAPSTELKRSYIALLRLGKGYNSGNADGLSRNQLNVLTSNEFEKDTYGEGQFFFYAKRKGYDLKNSQNALVIMNRSKFVPPLPDSEIYYRKDDK